MDTRDIGKDINARALPARASAQAGIVGGVLMALIGGGVFAVTFFTDSPITMAREAPVWLVAGLVSLVGVAVVVGSYLLLRVVNRRDESRHQHVAEAPSSR